MNESKHQLAKTFSSVTTTEQDHEEQDHELHVSNNLTKEDIEFLRVPELREWAKNLGIKPIPRLKIDIINTIILMICGSRDETNIVSDSSDGYVRSDATPHAAERPHGEDESTQVQERIRELVKEHGYVVIKTEPNLTYTIGSPLGFNLLISGLPGNVAQDIINKIVKQPRAIGQLFLPGEPAGMQM